MPAVLVQSIIHQLTVATRLHQDVFQIPAWADKVGLNNTYGTDHVSNDVIWLDGTPECDQNVSVAMTAFMGAELLFRHVMVLVGFV